VVPGPESNKACNTNIYKEIENFLVSGAHLGGLKVWVLYLSNGCYCANGLVAIPASTSLICRILIIEPNSALHGSIGESLIALDESMHTCDSDAAGSFANLD